MLGAVLSLINAVDSLFASFMPMALRVPAWGAVAGAAAMGVYILTSHQPSISGLKDRTRDLRRRMMDPSLESRAEFSRLAMSNLKVSMALFGKVIGPALISTLPVIVFVLWLDTYHAHVLPEGRRAVPVATVPARDDIEILPSELARRTPQGVSIVAPEAGAAKVTILVGNRTVYSGDPLSVPAPVITKKRWWSFILSSPSGYLYPDAPVEAVRIDLKRKHVIGAAPSWAAGWELPFFASLMVVVVALKLIFKVH